MFTPRLLLLYFILTAATFHLMNDSAGASFPRPIRMGSEVMCQPGGLPRERRGVYVDANGVAPPRRSDNCYMLQGRRMRFDAVIFLIGSFVREGSVFMCDLWCMLNSPKTSGSIKHGADICLTLSLSNRQQMGWMDGWIDR